MTSSQKRLSEPIAVLVGHLLVNVPTVVLLLIVGQLGRAFANSFALGVFVALAPAWLWWSLVIPRWRRWAVSKGADPERLQRIGEKAMLLWAKDSFFARTELPPRDRT